MDAHDIIGLVLTTTAFCSYINYKFIKLPPSIGITIIAVISTIFVKLISAANPEVYKFSLLLDEKLEFQDNFLHGMLGFLLFANAIHLNSKELLDHKILITVFATISVIISAVLIGCATFWLATIFGLHIPFYYCLAFGALISPTDAITVIAVLKTVAMPKSIETKIIGEALFNDGMGIALFFMAVTLAYGSNNAIEPTNTLLYFCREAGGGILFGFLLGWFGARVLQTIDDHKIAILFTLSLVAGGYVFAMDILQVSAPIAIAIAGLIVGYSFTVDNKKMTRSVTDFWEIIDQLLNAVLFVLIGIELISIQVHFKVCLLAIAVVFAGLIARWISIFIPVVIAQRFKQYNSGLVNIMAWSGIRGGISIALALSINGPYSDTILTMAYIAVLFSMIIQGLTLSGFVKRQLA